IDRTAAREVQRHDGVFTEAAALHEQDLEMRRNGQQRTQVGLGAGDDLAEGLAAVAHLHHAHAGAVPVEHLARGGLKHFLGHGGRAGREVVGARHHAAGSASPPSLVSPFSPPSGMLASFSTMRCRPESSSPSSSEISVTPCVARPISRISATRVRTSTPLSVISMIWSSVCTSVAATTLPLRSLCWMAIMPLVPRPWRVYSPMGVRLP